MIVFTVRGSGLRRFEEAIRSLGTEAKARRAYARAINRVGKSAGVAAGRALAAQTGLPVSTGKRATSRKIDRATPVSLSYVIHGQGGDISLKYFAPRETLAGVSARPFGQRKVFPSTFMKAGWWPNRVVKPAWNKQVFKRSNSDGHSYNVIKGEAGRKRVGTKFTKQKSGVFIPIEMVQGQTAAAFDAAAMALPARIEHEIRVMTKGVVS